MVFFFFFEAYIIETFASIYSLSLYVLLATRCVLYNWFCIVMGTVVKLDDFMILGLPYDVKLVAFVTILRFRVLLYDVYDWPQD